MPVTTDILIIGLGHAGCEAALACARMGLSVTAVTLRADRSAVMSCNPAVGGTAKGHLVKELDALGGEMAFAADRAGTHFVTLNASKGPAVRATRVLCDRDAYARLMQATLATQPGLTIIEGEAHALLVDGRNESSESSNTEARGSGLGARGQSDRSAASEPGTIRGVRLTNGSELLARAVVVTTGTFLQALMHVGQQTDVGGRLGDQAARGLSDSLRSLGFTLGRFKTGTPPRLARASIDFDRCTPQPGEEAPRPFSLRTATAPFPLQPRVVCHLTHTNVRTHQVLRDNLHRSPLYQGDIKGRGPRYCPSLEDKVVRFASRERHTIFLEPEGPDSPLVYPAGISTSLPAEVQEDFLRTIAGLEAVKVERYGYAVEYDYAPPTQLWPTLETKRVRGLFFAGQLNGTSGYEEAAFQGLLAGINAGLQVQGAPPLVLGRHEAHGAVLLDDLVTRGVDEPFRMFTARSEHRLKLREGNADQRLRAHGHRVGLVADDQLQRTAARWAQVRAEVERLERARLDVLLKRPEVTYAALAAQDPARPALPADVAAEVETELKYQGYIAQAEASWLRRGGDTHDGWAIPHQLRFADVPGLSNEARDRLERARPQTVGQARRLPGLTPAAVGLLLVHLKRTGAPL